MATELDGEYIPDWYLTLAGCLGSFVNGALLDKFGFNKVYMLLLILQLTCSICIYPLRHYGVAFDVFLFISFWCEGAHFSLFPAAAAKLYGLAEVGAIYTISFFAVPVSAIIAFILAIYKEYTGEYSIFIVGSALTALNMIMLLFFDDEEMKIEYRDSLGYPLIGNSNISL
jgi:MFS family permease